METKKHKISTEVIKPGSLTKNYRQILSNNTEREGTGMKDKKELTSHGTISFHISTPRETLTYQQWSIYA